MRVVIADDEVLLRDGLARLLGDLAIDVVGKAGTPDELLDAVAREDPDVAIVDIRMPPTHSDEGLLAAERIRLEHPRTGVLVLSHHIESRYAMRLLQDQPRGAGYLLKERVSDIAVLADALKRIDEGECVLDPTIVARLLHRSRDSSLLGQLSDRERDVLALIAEGRSNRAISEALFVSPKTVETHVGQIFAKLGLDETPDYHRRVLAVLAFLRAR
jgi:serine/threonine-protein kinase